MALQTLPSPIFFPNFGHMNNAPIVFTSSTLTAIGHYRAFIFCAREDMTISHVVFRVGTVANTPTAEVRIETVDASGLPSGNLWGNANGGSGANTNGTTGALSSNTMNLQAMTNAAVILRGQLFCIKIVVASGSSPSMILQHIAGSNPVDAGLPYVVVNTGTPTVSALNGGVTPLLGLGSSATAFYQVQGICPINATGGGAFNNSVAGAKRGMVATLPYKCRVIGIRWYNGSSAGDHNIVLMDNAGSELGNSLTAFDGDQSAKSNGPMMSEFFDNPVVVNAGSTVRAAIEPTTTTNVNVSTWALTSADYRGALQGRDTVSYATFTTGGGWVDSNINLPLMDLIIDQLDDGVGGGGLSQYVIG